VVIWGDVDFVSPLVDRSVEFGMVLGGARDRILGVWYSSRKYIKVGEHVKARAMQALDISLASTRACCPLNQGDESSYWKQTDYRGIKIRDMYQSGTASFAHCRNID